MSGGPANGQQPPSESREGASIVEYVDISKPSRGYSPAVSRPYVPPSQWNPNSTAGQQPRQSYWETELITAPFTDCCFCLGSSLGTVFCAYAQREMLLERDMTRYTCFGGLCGDLSCLVPRGLEQCCLATEVFLCPFFAVFGNRFMVLQHYGLEESVLNAAIVAGCCLIPLATYSLNPQLVPGVWLFVQDMTFGCLLTQQQHQLRVQGYPRTLEML